MKSLSLVEDLKIPYRKETVYRRPYYCITQLGYKQLTCSFVISETWPYSKITLLPISKGNLVMGDSQEKIVTIVILILRFWENVSGKIFFCGNSARKWKSEIFNRLHK